MLTTWIGHITNFQIFTEGLYEAEKSSKTKWKEFRWTHCKLQDTWLFSDLLSFLQNLPTILEAMMSKKSGLWKCDNKVSLNFADTWGNLWMTSSREIVDLDTWFKQPISNKHNLAYSLAVDWTTLKVSKSLISALHFF